MGCAVASLLRMAPGQEYTLFTPSWGRKPGSQSFYCAVNGRWARKCMDFPMCQRGQLVPGMSMCVASVFSWLGVGSVPACARASARGHDACWCACGSRNRTAGLEFLPSSAHAAHGAHTWHILDFISIPLLPAISTRRFRSGRLSEV